MEAKKIRRFVYDKRWSNKPEFLELVRKGWNLSQSNPLGTVSERIASCRKLLSKWKRNEDGRACLQSGDSWSPPEEGRIKCNIHANWRNASLHSGIAWIARDHSGNVIHHTRDAIVNAPNRLIAEIRCVMEAIKLPLQWPRYRALLHQITKLKENFVTITFEGETIQTNGIARDIARSVLRDGRFQSYLALRGPSWLQDRIAREETRSRD
ncbi:hypothetical protein HID58_095508 [Brassica napus]|uniref:RNase H type-1 domain-containing protein n=1 Tax=Brassica napus TaxID=3708 RepID=A0ABQ7X3F7_BRANA|nr:hypothetical protein HID58_095508 [Brassica napus]